MPKREGEKFQNLLPLPHLLWIWQEHFKAKLPFLAGGLEDADIGSDRWLHDALDLEDP